MGRCALEGVSIALICAAGTAWALPAAAQDQTATTSNGERYEYEDIYEYGEGSSTHTLNIVAQLGSEEVVASSQSRYFQPYSWEEVQQAASPGYSYAIDGAVVSVLGWSAPEFRDSAYEIIDVLNEVTSYNEVVTRVTSQTTSGDAPDAVVPVGWRGSCYFDGTSGATNIDPYDGQFALCDYADSYVDVAPGTINTNTHTTTVYRQGTRYFQVVDDAYVTTYAIRPIATATTSTGTVDMVTSRAVLIRNDDYRVRFTGTLLGEATFSQTVAGQFSDAPVQASLASLSRPVGHALGGVPVVLLWSDPVRTGTASELVSSTVDTQSEIQSGVQETVTTTHGGQAGGLVFIGDRGSCTDTGIAGTTNGPSPTGAAANCAGGVVYGLDSGQTNTNTHTSFVTTTILTATTTENWRITDDWQLVATPFAVGQIHAAVRDTLHKGSGDFVRRHADALGTGRRNIDLWAAFATGSDRVEADAAGPGSRNNMDTVAGGVSARLSDLVRAGIAIGHDSARTRLSGPPESGKVALTQVGAAIELSPGSWRVRLAASRGWGEIDTLRGNAMLGGEARAGYDASTWSISADAGPELSLGKLLVRPLAAVDWTRTTLGSFTEQGGIALAGPEDDSASRTALSAGLEGSLRMELGNGPTLRFWADGRAGRIVDGRARTRDVSFAGTPGALLRVTSASERGSFGEARGGVALITAGGLGLHLGVETRFGDDARSWGGTAGLSMAF